MSAPTTPRSSDVENAPTPPRRDQEDQGDQGGDQGDQGGGQKTEGTIDAEGTKESKPSNLRF